MHFLFHSFRNETLNVRLEHLMGYCFQLFKVIVINQGLVFYYLKNVKCHVWPKTVRSFCSAKVHLLNMFLAVKGKGEVFP